MDNIESPDFFLRLIGKSVAIFLTHVPVCKPDEIFVEYQRHIHHSQLIRSGVKLSADESDILKPGTFCIDGIVDSERNASMTKDKHGIIIRTCRPRDLCKEIPCVRRCCRNEMMMQRVDGKVKCVEYARNIKPTFYDLDSPSDGSVENYSIVEPAGK